MPTHEVPAPYAGNLGASLSYVLGYQEAKDGGALIRNPWQPGSIRAGAWDAGFLSFTPKDLQ